MWYFKVGMWVKYILSVAALFLSCHSYAQEVGRINSLNDCISYATTHSYETLKETLNIDNAKADKKQAFWAHFPSASGVASVATNFGRGVDPATNSYTTNATLNNNYGIELSQAIFSGGQLFANSKIAELGKGKSELSLNIVEDAIAEQTMMAYIEALYNLKLVELHRQMVENYTIQEQRMVRMESIGSSSTTDVAQIRVALSKEKLTVIKSQQAYDISVIKLKRIMNYPSQDTLMIENALSEELLQNSKETSKQIIDYASLNNLKIRTSQYDVDINKISLSTAKKAYYPSVSLRGGLNSQYFAQLNKSAVSAQSWSDQINNNLGYWVNVTVSVPIFNGLQIRTKVRKTANSLKAAGYMYDDTRNVLSNEVESLMIEVRSLEAQQLQAKENVSNNRIANESFKRKYEQGAIGVLDFQSSNNQLLEAEVEALYIHLNCQIKLKLLNYYKGIPYVK